MKLSRRGLISVVSALAATTIGFAAPARAADTKEIVYLTPGLDLPFWRYLSNGIEAEAKKAGYSYTALELEQQRRDPAQERAGRDRARRRGHRDFAHRQLDRAKRSRRRRARENSGRRRGHRHQQRRLCLVHHLRQQTGRVRRRRGAGRGAEGKGLDRRLGRPHHDLASAQERPGAHRGLPRSHEERRHHQGSRACSRCSPIRPTRRSSSPRTC